MWPSFWPEDTAHSGWNTITHQLKLICPIGHGLDTLDISDGAGSSV